MDCLCILKLIRLMGAFHCNETCKCKVCLSNPAQSKTIFNICANISAGKDTDGRFRQKVVIRRLQFREIDGLSALFHWPQKRTSGGQKYGFGQWRCRDGTPLAKKIQIATPKSFLISSMTKVDSRLPNMGN